ncbi:MAG: response regulator [Lachnospiraceae bacterium]|nr:response regulator [Lachnospiraceae bacterium]
MGNQHTSDWVVMVDDDTINLKFAGAFLRESGLRVTTLNNGQALCDWLSQGNVPDLIMLDILMPEMNGFETLEAVRTFERENALEETPVIFLTATEDNEVEARGFSMGAVDYIRKPFEPEVLIHRIQNVLANSRKIQALSEEASTDRLTGLLNKECVNDRLEKVCYVDAGVLLVIDLDSFKLVNDLYGHEAGDRVLAGFAGLLRSSFRAEDLVGRIGGDEFVAFLKDVSDEEAVVGIIHRLNDRLRAVARNILGEDMEIPLGVSAGAVISTGAASYEDLFQKADKSLLYVKQNGKHDCKVWDEPESAVDQIEEQTVNMRRMNMILDERNIDRHALMLGQEAFGNIYRYMLRYIQRYREKAYKVLFTITADSKDMTKEELSSLVTRIGEAIRNALRNSDIMMQSAPCQFFLLLPMVEESDIRKVTNRVLEACEKVEGGGKVSVIHETESVRSVDENRTYPVNAEPWVLVVDDDLETLKTAGSILSENEMRVTALNSGKALLKYVEQGNRPDLILLDVVMPELDGFETMRKLRETEIPGEEIPIIFLTGAEDKTSEAKGLSLGAMDYIRKPFLPEVLTLRVMKNIRVIRMLHGHVRRF